MFFRRIKISNHLTWLSIVGLILGILGGYFYNQIESSKILTGLVDGIEIIGMIWVNILQVIAIPLIILIIWLALSVEFTKGLGKLGMACVVLFLIFHLLGGLFVLAISPTFLYLTPVPELSQLEYIMGKLSFSSNGSSIEHEGFISFLNALFANDLIVFAKRYLWIWLLLPITINLFSHLIIKRDIIETQKLKFALDSVFRLIVWLIHLAPVGVMGVIITLTKSMGFSITAILGYFLISICCILLLYNLMLVSIIKFVGNFKLTDMLKALKHPYVVAFSTRSSLAALPVLTEEVQKYLPISARIVGFSFPLTASLFKGNRIVSSTFNLLFIAHIFQIHLSWVILAVFMGSLIVVSVTSQGIPGGGHAYEGLPLFVAAGVPAEGYFLLRTVNAIPDIFSTLINTTCFLLIATFLNRFYSQFKSGISGYLPDKMI